MHGRLTSIFICLFLAYAVHAEAQGGSTPGPPTGFACQPTGAFVECTWGPPIQEPSQSIFNYRVTLVPRRPNQPIIEHDAGLTNITRIGPILDGTYDAFVQAQNINGFGSASVFVIFTIAPVSSPQNFRVTISGNSVTFLWDLPEGGSEPRQYLVEVGIPGVEIPCDASAPCPPTTSLNAGISRTVTTTLVNGVYLARVRAVESERLGDASNEITFIVGPPPTGAVPFPPTDLRADIRDATVTLTWNLRRDSPAPSSFLVDVTPDGATAATTIDTRSPSRQITFGGVPVGTYSIRVRARNVHGISQMPSQAIAVGVGRITSCNPDLTAPTGLSAVVSGNIVTLTWARPEIATNLSSYVIQAGTAPGLSNLANFSTGNQNTLITAGAPSGTYFVRVRAEDFCGRSAPSNEITVVVP